MQEQRTTLTTDAKEAVEARRFAVKASPWKRYALPAILTVVAAILALGTMPERSFAQQETPAAPAEAARGVQILMLGTQGGPRQFRDRSQPATMLTVDGRSYLIDTGAGTVRRMLEAGVRSETIGTIFLTHSHPDHVLGLVDVLANNYTAFHLGFPGARSEFDIYGAAETPELVNAAWEFIRIPYGIFAAGGLGRPEVTNPFEAHVIDEELVYKDDKIRVSAVENTHYEATMPASLRKRHKTYSYRFETLHGVIAFTGDTGPSEAVEDLAQGADVLVAEVMDFAAIEQLTRAHFQTPDEANAMLEHMGAQHLTMEAVGELASESQVKSVILHHYSGRPGESGEHYADGVKQHFSGPVFGGEDLARYCLAAGDTQESASALRPCR